MRAVLRTPRLEAAMNLSVLNFDIVDRVGVITMNFPPVNALGIPFLEDFQKGYIMHDRVIRPSKVKVAKAVSPANSEEDEQAE